MRKIVAPCGLVCNECEAYAATQAGDAGSTAALAREWRGRYGIAFGRDDIWCDGCTSGSERTTRHTRQCPIRPCARERGLASCAECNEYRCGRLKRLYQVAPQAMETLEAIRRGEGYASGAGSISRPGPSQQQVPETLREGYPVSVRLSMQIFSLLEREGHCRLVAVAVAR